MEKFKSIVSAFFVIIGIAFGIFIFVKSSVLTIWSSPSVPETYAINGADGRSIKIIFLPENKTIMWYKDPNVGSEEYNLVEMKGTYGTHYFWGLWKIEGPGIAFGYRFYPDGTEPVVMETKTIQKYMNGKGDPNFSPVGKITNTTWLFRKDSAKFQDMWLQKEENNNLFISQLLNNLER